MKHLNAIAVFSALCLSLFCFSDSAYARSAKEIDAKVDAALELFEKTVFDGKAMLAKAKGVLVLPKVIKGGIGFGAEYGVGALRVEGKTVDYYNTMAGTFGFQLGGQVRNIYILFMEDRVLQEFKASEGWKAGVDGSIALITVGFAGAVDTLKTDQPIIAYVLDQKGLMYNLTLEGSKYNKIRAY